MVHNAGLRICSGAFKTSPVESIYVDTDQLPLDLRRGELGLRYIMKLSGSPENPANITVDQLEAVNFQNARASKPLNIRLEASLENESIENRRIKEIRPSKHPPG